MTMPTLGQYVTWSNRLLFGRLSTSIHEEIQYGIDCGFLQLLSFYP